MGWKEHGEYVFLGLRGQEWDGELTLLEVQELSKPLTKHRLPASLGPFPTFTHSLLDCCIYMHHFIPISQSKPLPSRDGVSCNAFILYDSALLKSQDLATADDNCSLPSFLM